MRAQARAGWLQFGGVIKQSRATGGESEREKSGKRKLRNGSFCKVEREEE